MKSLSILAIYVAVICGLSSCADTGTSSTTSSSGEGVAGEKVTGEERLGAGVNGMSPSAQVKW